MLAPDTKKLDQILIRILATTPNSTAHALHAAAGTFRASTIQGVYHELRKLQAEGVVLKVGDRYSLSLTWAFEFMNLADAVYDSYILSPSKSEILPEDNGSTTWRFTNLLRLDDFWVQTMVIVFRHTKSRSLYNWIPHPWYYFAQMSKVNQFYALFQKEGWRYYSTLGGDTFLDRRYAEAMPKSFFKCRLGEAPVFSDMSKYCTIIGDYMMTVKLDPATANRVEELFSSVTSMKNFEVDSAVQLLTRPGKLTFKLEHNPKKIGSLTRKYQRYFGLSD